MMSLPQVVLSRHKASSPHDQDGWVVGCPDAELPPHYARFNFIVETVVADMNWSGDVWVGGKCVPAPAKDDGIPQFRCEERT